MENVKSTAMQIVRMLEAGYEVVVLMATDHK